MMVAARGRTLLVSAFVLGLGIAASVLGARLAAVLLDARAEEHFAGDAAAVNAEIGQRLKAHAEVLVSMQGLYASVGRIDRAQFQRYVDVLDLVRRYPGFAALQVLQRVAPDQLAAFVADVRADSSLDPRGQPEFAVHPAGARSAYFVIYFIEPMRGNERAFGYDVGSSPVELEGLDRSVATGRIVATPPIRLVQDTSGGLGFVLRAPIYQVGLPVATAEQRRAALFGFAAAVYRMNDLMQGVLDARTLQQMIVRVSDHGYARVAADGLITAEPERPEEPASLIYDSREPNLRAVTPVAVAPLGITAELPLVVGDRLWRVSFAAKTGSVYAPDSTLPRLVLASGGVISLLAAIMTAIALRSRRLRGDLATLDAEQRAVVENPLAGVMFLHGRTVARANRRLASMCAADPEGLAGRDVVSLFASAKDHAAFLRALDAVERGGSVGLELMLQVKNGAGLPVDAFGRPLGAFGPRGASATVWVLQDKSDALLREDERHAHEEALSEANARLTASLEAAEQRTHEIALLTELSGVLQSCRSLDEVFRSVQTYAVRLFAGEAGGLYVFNTTRDQMVRGARWGTPAADAASFAPDDCWALRRGRVFPSSEASRGLLCRHVAACCPEGATPGYVCQPLFAQSTQLGLLYREPVAEAGAASAQLATMLAEQVSLAIANLELREQLKGQALRDPLTGLGNRRFLESALRREAAAATRGGRPLALALLDLDHFKQVNDSFGHEAGDAVLRAMGEVLREHTRVSDTVGRYGGEEFLVLLPDTGVDGALAVAGHLLDAVRRLTVLWPGGVLDAITASIGVAVFPQHVESADDLVAAADAALYRAKAAGRNRIALAEGLTPPLQPSFAPAPAS